MIRAYDEYYLNQTQHKLGVVFELAVNFEKLGIDDLANKFIQSKISKAFERADPVYVSGKSANELLGLILGKPPIEVEQSMACSPEYWVGHVLAYAQWYFNVSFKELIEKCPCGQLVTFYFPYHEMDITKTIELIQNKLQKTNALKELRLKRGLSQSDLSKISHVPLRTIKAYEQTSDNLQKAQAKTLYMFARTLDCTIEDLLE